MQQSHKGQLAKIWLLMWLLMLVYLTFHQRSEAALQIHVTLLNLNKSNKIDRNFSSGRSLKSDLCYSHSSTEGPTDLLWCMQSDVPNVFFFEVPAFPNLVFKQLCNHLKSQHSLFNARTYLTSWFLLCSLRFICCLASFLLLHKLQIEGYLVLSLL